MSRLMIEIEIPDDMNPQEWRDLVVDIFILSFKWEGLQPIAFRHAICASLSRVLLANIQNHTISPNVVMPKIAALSRFMRGEILGYPDDESSQTESS